MVRDITSSRDLNLNRNDRVYLVFKRRHENFGDYFGLLSDPHGDGLDIPDDEKKQLLQQQQSLLANLFASISAVNAAYVQLQVAQSSCDLESIVWGRRCRCRAQAHLRAQALLLQKPVRPSHQSDSAPGSFSAAPGAENLVETHRITACKLRLELDLKDSEILE
ncbi:hypothetical protein GW17_00060263 [Ensete ventricosum]|nr:hypothetical protein GW17_00060263 [Ensete ventricosum]